MKAYYYRIYDALYPLTTFEEGIIRNSEDTIYPEIWLNDDAPYIRGEFECHHFPKDDRVKIEGFYFDIPVEVLEQFKMH